MDDDIETESADDGTLCAFLLDAGLHKDGQPLLTQAFLGKVKMDVMSDILNILKANEVA